ncbi:hypothetical protein DPMN_027304 [Dreissena polymorpha]|uniref:Uncharacterized protein n=1 Tax=Dreissena polymorpha TaxID=45954 RepID=A0A9D4LV21_DREPO|nr:hypothetical protein DPMN_027304 [Dreissena polymorpha]
MVSYKGTLRIIHVNQGIVIKAETLQGYARTITVGQVSPQLALLIVDCRQRL